MSKLDSFIFDLLESRRIDKELDNGPIKYDGKLIVKGTREEGKEKTYKVGNNSKRGFFQHSELSFSKFFDDSIVKLAKEFKEDKISKQEFKRAILKRILKASELFEKDVESKGIEKHNDYVNNLVENSYFLVDSIFGIILGNKTKDDENLFKLLVEMSDDLRKRKKDGKEEKIIFDSYITHFKVIEHLIDIVLNKGGEEVKRILVELEANQD